MKALCWHGKGDVRVDTVSDPKIAQPDDVVIRVTATAICGSDLHLYNKLIPGAMQEGDILGHEFMGEVVETGKSVTKLKKGDRIVVPFVIACGECFFCNKQLWSLCDNTNRDAEKLAKLHGHAGAGLFGYSHLYGGYAGGQAEYVRVPHADVGPLKIESNLPDEKVLFLSDIFPTGWMAAENANIEPSDSHLGLWTCRSDDHQERVDAGRRACHRHRLRKRALANGGGPGRRGDDRFQQGGCLRGAAGDDRRTRTGWLHRCRRRGSAWLGQHSIPSSTE